MFKTTGSYYFFLHLSVSGLFSPKFGDRNVFQTKQINKKKSDISPPPNVNGRSLNQVYYVLGSIFLYTYPKIYDRGLPASYHNDNPNLVSILTGRQSHMKVPPWFDETLLVSKGSHYFRSFAKSAEFKKGK